MSDDPPLSRREMLFGRRASAESPPAADHAVPSPAPARAMGVVHRPPGAVAESTFLEGCTRCGDCGTACPVQAITIAGNRYGAAHDTPMIDPIESPCVMCADFPCIEACEPGVLTHAAPLKMGTASIRPTYCLAHQGTMCTVCVERCPVEGAIELRHGRPIIDAATCTGCGVCQHVCPAPYNAVLILPETRAGDVVDDAAASDAPAIDATATPDKFDWRCAYLGRERPVDPPVDPE